MMAFQKCTTLTLFFLWFVCSNGQVQQGGSSATITCKAGRDGLPGKDGKDGRDGRDGTNGRDGVKGDKGDAGRNCLCALQNVAKPSIHLDGDVAANRDIPKNTDITTWGYAGPNGHLEGRMRYHNGKITVPVTGRYFIYCQIYYNLPTTQARQHILVNNRVIALAHKEQSDITGTVYTGLVFSLKAGDTLSVQLHAAAKIWAGPMHSFFGAYLV